MQEELAVALGFMVLNAGLLVGVDVGPDEPGLAVSHVGVGLLQADASSRRDFTSPAQHDARLEALEEVVVAAPCGSQRSASRLPYVDCRFGCVGRSACIHCDMRRASIATAVLLVALVAAPGAAAHATLQQATPATTRSNRQSPPEVTLQFSEAVETAFGSIRVYDCGGSRVDSGKIIRPSESSVAVEIGRRLPAGTYTVTRRVISADAHPVAGAFVFHVKSATKGAECKSYSAKARRARSTRSSSSCVPSTSRSCCSWWAARPRSRPSFCTAAFELRACLYRIPAGLAVGPAVIAGFLHVLQGALAGGFGLSEAFRCTRSTPRARHPVRRRFSGSSSSRR